MLTAYDLMAIVAPIAGAWVGFEIGGRVGVAGSIGGAVLGVLLGRIVGRLPLILTVRSIRRSFAGQTAAELRQLLRREGCMTPNLILLELASLGEDIQKELDVVLHLLESDDSAKRSFGQAAITSAFPELAVKMKGYRPYASTEKCRLKVKTLRETLIQDFDDSCDDGTRL